MPKCGSDTGDEPTKCASASGVMQDWTNARMMDKLIKDGSGDGTDDAVVRRAFNNLQWKYPDLMDRLLLLIEQFVQSTKHKKKNQFLTGDMDKFRNFLSIPPPARAPPVYPVDPKLVDLLEEMTYLRQVGMGLSWEETMAITASIHCVIRAANYVKVARFWGKIIGQRKDYYILECDSPRGSPIQAMMENEQLGENYEGPDGEEDFLENQASSFLNILKIFEETESMYRKKFNKPKIITHGIDDLDVKIQQLKMTKPRIDHITFPPQPTFYVEPEIPVPAELHGVGCNANIYMVSTSPHGPWAELPNVTPQQIVVARNIRPYFTGELCQEVETNPEFPGTERNYLRAQIARITAATHVSPMNFYHFPGGEEDEELGGEEESTEIMLNSEYTPLSPDDLLGERGLDYWVHHTHYILEHGSCSMWSGSEGSWGEEPPPILRPIVCDTDGPGWWPEAAQTVGTWREAVMVRSLGWPGAIAWTAGRRAGCFYNGYGLKQPTSLPTFTAPTTEYAVGPDIEEFSDPTVEETKRWIAERQGPEWDMHEDGGEGEQLLEGQGDDMSDSNDE